MTVDAFGRWPFLVTRQYALTGIYPMGYMRWSDRDIRGARRAQSGSGSWSSCAPARAASTRSASGWILNQPQVSKHLRVLKEAGARRRGATRAAAAVRAAARSRSGSSTTGSIAIASSGTRASPRWTSLLVEPRGEIGWPQKAKVRLTSSARRTASLVLHGAGFARAQTTVFDAMTKPELYAPLVGAEVAQCRADRVRGPSLRVGGRYPAMSSVVRASRRWRSAACTARSNTARGSSTRRSSSRCARRARVLITATYTARTGRRDAARAARGSIPRRRSSDGCEIASGMERGMRETLDQLAALVPELDQAA